MLYENLNLKINDNQKTITISEGNEIKVLQYLPIHQKNDLIQISLQSAKEGGVYNELKLEMYFNIYLVFMYTDLVFSDEQRKDIETLYDELESSGLLDEILANMNRNEYDFLIDLLEKTKANNEKKDMSAAGVLQAFIQDLPKNATNAAEILKDVDLSKYKEVAEFAQAANGNRPIPSLVEN